MFTLYLRQKGQHLFVQKASTKEALMVNHNTTLRWMSQMSIEAEKGSVLVIKNARNLPILVAQAVGRKVWKAATSADYVADAKVDD